MLEQLLNTLPQRGEVRWIGLRPARRAPVESVASVQALAGQGLSGDRYKSRQPAEQTVFSQGTPAGARPVGTNADGGFNESRTGGKRQVTLLQWEHLRAIAGYLGRDEVDPALLRRNLLVRGINLLALKGKQFTVGGATLEYTTVCAPCSFMEETFGPGGYNAVRGHGGICARVIAGGDISVGSPVVMSRVADPLA